MEHKKILKKEIEWIKVKYYQKNKLNLVVNFHNNNHNNKINKMNNNNNNEINNFYLLKF